MLTRKAVVSARAHRLHLDLFHPARTVVAGLLGLALLAGCSTPEPKKARIDPQTGTLRVHPALVPATAGAAVATPAADNVVTTRPITAPTVEQATLPELPPVAVPPAPTEPVPPAMPGKKPRKK